MPAHNLVYMSVAKSGAWASFVQWVTIDPEPWTEDDPARLAESNALFPTLEAMCDALPDLTQRIDPDTGLVKAESALRQRQPHGHLDDERVEDVRLSSFPCVKRPLLM